MSCDIHSVCAISVHDIYIRWQGDDGRTAREDDYDVTHWHLHWRKRYFLLCTVVVSYVCTTTYTNNKTYQVSPYYQPYYNDEIINNQLNKYHFFYLIFYLIRNPASLRFFLVIWYLYPALTSNRLSDPSTQPTQTQNRSTCLSPTCHSSNRSFYCLEICKFKHRLVE